MSCKCHPYPPRAVTMQYSSTFTILGEPKATIKEVVEGPLTESENQHVIHPHRSATWITWLPSTPLWLYIKHLTPMYTWSKLAQLSQLSQRPLFLFSFKSQVSPIMYPHLLTLVLCQISWTHLWPPFPSLYWNHWIAPLPCASLMASQEPLGYP